MANSWRHVLCANCYDDREPGRTPHIVVGADAEPCCDCGREVDEPIFYRHDPADMGCEGQGGTHGAEDDAE